jgi:hypothetical protein
MSAVLTRRRRARARGRDTERQASLFGQVVAPPPQRPSSPAAPPSGRAPVATASAPVHEPVEAAVFDVPTTDDPDVRATALAEPTLDEAICGLWAGLLASEPGDCPLCGSALAPRHSAGAGVVGGRCTGCSATLA